MNKVTKNNKGFSLVELIIVIAIMAVLIAILAPAFIRYVEQSRQNADLTAVDEIITAVKTEAANGQIVMTSDAAVVTLSNTQGAKSDNTSVDKALQISDVKGATLKSSRWGTVSITFTETSGGSVNAEVSNSDTDDVDISVKYKKK